MTTLAITRWPGYVLDMLSRSNSGSHDNQNRGVMDVNQPFKYQQVTHIYVMQYT